MEMSFKFTSLENVLMVKVSHYKYILRFMLLNLDTKEKKKKERKTNSNFYFTFRYYLLDEFTGNIDF